jgi:cytochrome P450
MLIPVTQAALAGIPLPELATRAAPGRWHEALRSLGTHQHDGAWIVSTPADVEAALESRALAVAPPARPAGPAATLLGQMARFSNGPDHERRRELVMRLLPPVTEVSLMAGDRTDHYVRRRAAAFDVMPLARVLPAEVLATAMGLTARQAGEAAWLTGRLCDAVAPGMQPQPGEPEDDDADEAASALCALMSGFGPAGEADAIAAAASILFQARDATAALIGLAVLDTSDRESPHQRVEHVLRCDAPVQCTRRSTVAEAAVGGELLPAGAQVWAFVAAAERGTGVPATFGSGPHGCPAAAHATAIARQVVTVLDADGWRLAPGQQIELEPRPNIRSPRRVLVSRA